MYATFILFLLFVWWLCYHDLWNKSSIYHNKLSFIFLLFIVCMIVSITWWWNKVYKNNLTSVYTSPINKQVSAGSPDTGSLAPEAISARHGEIQQQMKLAIMRCQFRASDRGAPMAGLLQQAQLKYWQKNKHHWSKHGLLRSGNSVTRWGMTHPRRLPSDITLTVTLWIMDLWSVWSAVEIYQVSQWCVQRWAISEPSSRFRSRGGNRAPRYNFIRNRRHDGRVVCVRESMTHQTKWVVFTEDRSTHRHVSSSTDDQLLQNLVMSCPV